MSRPSIIAHRGASGERPEHTRAAYELAIAQGADFIEPDLVMSRDGELIVRHENEISGTTDVAARPGFAGRRATKTIDGIAVTGWFTEDFTLAELKTLKARERLPELRPGNTAWDGAEPILTFAEVVAVARKGARRTGRPIGLCPELKHPSYFAGLGLAMEDAFVATLAAEALDDADALVLVQCFEVGPLRRLAGRIGSPLLQLMAAEGGPFDRPGLTYAEMATPRGLKRVAEYAGWVGVDAVLVEDDDGAPSRLVADAHAAGLKVAAWTFRAEDVFMPPRDRGDLAGRLRRFGGHGLDAAFCDFPGVAAEAFSKPE